MLVPVQLVHDAVLHFDGGRSLFFLFLLSSLISRSLCRGVIKCGVQKQMGGNIGYFHFFFLYIQSMIQAKKFIHHCCLAVFQISLYMYSDKKELFYSTDHS